MNERQQRAWGALALGPRWRLRAEVHTHALPLAPSSSACAGQACGCAASAWVGEGPAPAPWLLIAGAAAYPAAPIGHSVALSQSLLGQILTALMLRPDQDVNVLTLTPAHASASSVSARVCPSCLQTWVGRVAPRVVVVLGEWAAQAIWSRTDPLAAWRGHTHALDGPTGSVTAVVTHHPADLVVRPLDKAQAWADWCLARQLARG